MAKEKKPRTEFPEELIRTLQKHIDKGTKPDYASLSQEYNIESKPIRMKVYWMKQAAKNGKKVPKKRGPKPKTAKKTVVRNLGQKERKPYTRKNTVTQATTNGKEFRIPISGMRLEEGELVFTLKAAA